MTKVLETDSLTETQENWDCTKRVFETGLSPFFVVDPAAYLYRYGDKLKRVDSDFPGESAVVEYNYDALGKRRNKLIDSTDLTWYRWDAGWSVLAEYGESQAGGWEMGTRERTYVGKLAYADGADPSSGADYYYHFTDHLGSVRRTRAHDKTSVATYEYKPYGALHQETGSLDLNIGYTGHFWDPDIQQYYAPFRYYSPTTARWLTRDPMGMIDGPNLYGYGKGNPTSKKDFYGLACGSGWSDAFVPDKWPNIGVDFTRACEKHDACYGCSGAKAGSSRLICDMDFYDDLMKECDTYAVEPDSQANCEALVKIYYAAVRILGGGPFSRGRHGCCDEEGETDYHYPDLDDFGPSL